MKSGAFEEYESSKRAVGPEFFKTLARMYMLNEKERKDLELLYEEYPIECTCYIQGCDKRGRLPFKGSNEMLGPMRECDECKQYVCYTHSYITELDPLDDPFYSEDKIICIKCKKKL